MVIKVKRIVVIFVLVALVIIGFFGIKLGIKQIQKSIYKIEYSELVNQFAKEYNLDPYFIYAVIKTESNFKPEAVSNVGARGLMQVMPNTFDWVNSKIKSPDTTFDDMYKPEDNIRYGGYLLSYLINEFDNYEEALAGYHAGRTAVNKWLKDPAYSSDGKTLDNIPISDTAHYVHKVMKNYKMYQKLYQ